MEQTVVGEASAKPDSKAIALTGLKKGVGAFWWLIKVLVPISLATMLLQWFGVMAALEFIFRPLMAPLGLPPEAAFPLLIGLTAGFYGGLAVMTALPFTLAQLNLMGVFLLLAHSLIQEAAIQARSGLGATKSVVIRLGAAVLTVAVLSRLMGGDTAAPILTQAAAAARPEFMVALTGWLWSTVKLCLTILVIVSVLTAAMDLMKAHGWVEKADKPLRPFLRAMGLSRRSGFLWLTAVVFGLVYGAALIMEEARAGYLDDDELEDLQVSIGLNHSMIEDTIIFAAIGCNILWIAVPRLAMAVLAVRLNRLARRMFRRPRLA